MNHLSTDTLNLYLDDTLDAATRVETDQHLAVCPECAHERAALRAVFTSLETLPETRIPVDLSTRVVSQLEPARFWRAPLVAALCVESLIAVALAVWLIPVLESFSLDWIQWSEALTTLENLWNTILDSSRAAFDLSTIVPLDPSAWAVLVGTTGIVWLVGSFWLTTYRISHGTMEVEG